MSAAYKNKGTKLSSTSSTVVYTCPLSQKAVIKSIYLSNTHSTNPIEATIKWSDFDDSGIEYSLITSVSIAPKSTFQLLDTPIVLEPQDALLATASIADILEVTIAALEVPS